jgi:hypothetical protein
LTHFAGCDKLQIFKEAQEVCVMIRIGIVGYGNLARGVECAIRQNPDMTLAAVFTRRDPASVQILTPDVPVLSVNETAQWKDRIDLMLLCSGSAKDLPEMTPAFARDFHVVDSFDTHANIPEHFAAVDAAAKQSGHIAPPPILRYIQGESSAKAIDKAPRLQPVPLRSADPSY